MQVGVARDGVERFLQGVGVDDGAGVVRLLEGGADGVAVGRGQRRAEQFQRVQDALLGGIVFLVFIVKKWTAAAPQGAGLVSDVMDDDD